MEALITHNVFNGPSHADKQNCNGVGPAPRDTYTQCRASRSELVRLKVLVCEHDCCNRSMHGTVLGSLDGYIIVFLLSLKRVCCFLVLPLLSFPERSQTPSSLFPVISAILHILRCHVRAHAQNIRES